MAGVGELDRPTDGRRRTTTTNVLPSCVIARSTDVEKSVACDRAPRREAAIERARDRRCARTIQNRTPTADRADDDGRERNGRAAVRSSTCGSTRARTNVRTVACASTSWRTTAVVARGEAGSSGRPAEDRSETAAPRRHTSANDHQDQHDHHEQVCQTFNR